MPIVKDRRAQHALKVARKRRRKGRGKLGMSISNEKHCDDPISLSRYSPGNKQTIGIANRDQFVAVLARVRMFRD